MKKFVKITNFIKHILDPELNFIIDKLIMSAPAVKKRFIKAIFQKEVVQFCINNLSSIKAFKALMSYFWYFMRLPKAIICWVNGS